VAFGDGSRQLQIRRLEPVGAWDMLTESFFSQTYSISLNRAHGLLAVGGDPFVAKLWSYPDLKLVQNLSLIQPAGDAGGGTTDRLGLHLPLDVTISPDGKLVASVAGTGVLVWKSADGRRVAAVETPADTYAVTFDHSGARLFAAGASNAVYAWKTDGFTFERVFHVGAAVASLTPHPTVSRIAVGTANSIVLLETRTGAIDWRAPAASPVTATAFAADGSLIATGDAAGRVMLIDAATGKMRWTRQHEDEIRSVDFSPDGRSIISASGSPITQMRLAGDSSVRVWTLLGEPVLRMDEPAPTGGATFDGDGRIVAAHARMIRRIAWQEPALVDKACAALSRNLTLNEWTSLVPDRPYQATCIKLPPHPTTQSPRSH
jgi:WD40 repeat protein